MLAKKSVLDKQEIQERKWIGLFLIICLILAIIVSILVIGNIRIKKKSIETESKLRGQEIDLLQTRLANILEDQSNANFEINQVLLNDYLKNPLSERELDVLSKVADGKTNKEIADELFVSVNTIKTHILNIYEKLDVQNRTQATVKAGSLDLIRKTSQKPV